MTAMPYVKLLCIAALAAIGSFMAADGVSAAPNDLVFVASSETPVQSLKTDEILNIYLGKQRVANGFPVSAIDHSETETIKRTFLERVMRMTHAQYREQLMRRRFQEGAVTPKFVTSADEALNVARETPGAIAYVYESDAGTLRGLKVLATIPAK
ncbi:MAG TPA: hypothetical protein VFN94_02630 [Nitrospiria bacterium]|nr:hypothetical protein [Nitrospiria bacterium]